MIPAIAPNVINHIDTMTYNHAVKCIRDGKTYEEYKIIQANMSSPYAIVIYPRKTYHEIVRKLDVLAKRPSKSEPEKEPTGKIKRIYTKGTRGKYAGYIYTPHKTKGKQYMLLPYGQGNRPDNAHFVLTLEEVYEYLKRGWSVRVSNCKGASSSRVLSAMTIEYYD